MADKASNVVLNFKMDGQVQYAKTLREINAIMNTAAKEYKNHIAAMGSDASATDKLRAEKKKLEVQMEAAQERTKMLRAQYEAMSKDTKTTTGQLAQMYGKLQDAERAEMALQKSLDRVNQELSEKAIAVREAQNALAKLGDEANELEAEQRRLASAFELERAELGKNATEAQKVELAQRQLSAQMNLAERAVKNLEQQLEQSKRAYGENSREVKQMETRLNQAKTTLAKFKNEMDQVEKSTKDAERSFDGFKSAAGAIGGAIPTAAVKGLVDSTRELSTDLARLTTNAQIAGRDIDIVNEAFKQTAAITGETDSAVETLSNILASGFKDEQLSVVIDNINGAAIRFSDTLKTEGIADGIQETFATGAAIGQFAELLERSGVDLEKFNEGLADAKAKGEGANYILEQMSKLGLTETLDKYKKLNPEIVKANEASIEYEMAMKDLGDTLRPLVTEVAEFTTKIIEWANENPNLSRTLAVITMAIGAIISVASVLSPIITAVSLAFGGLSVSLLPIIGIIAGVVAAITAIIIVVKNWGAITDWISDKWSQFTTWLSENITNLKDSFVNKFNEIKDGVVNKVTELKDKASETITSFKDNVVGKITELKDGFVNKVSELKDGATNKISELKSKGAETVQSFKDNVVNKASELKTGFVNRVTEMRENAVNRFKEIRDRAGSAFETARRRIVEPIEKARNKIKEIIDKIKGFFSGLKLKIPKIDLPKLPHFRLEGGFSLNPPSVPKIDIDWRAKGAIFTQPTIFGMSNGRLQGAGEAGPEAALPLNEETLGAIGRGIAETMGTSGEVIIPVTLEIDGEVLARKTVRYNSIEMRNLQDRSKRGGGRGW